MSNTAKSRIVVSTEDIGIVDLKILDGRFQTAAQGRGYLSVELPPGIYKVEAAAGSQSWSQLVALDEGETESINVPLLVLHSSAPIYRSQFEHEYHEAAAYNESHKEHAVRGTGSAIFIMVRYFSPDQEKPTRPPDHPMAGLSLHDQNGNPIVDLLAESAYHAPNQNEPDPWAACNVAVTPGYYRLRQELYPGKIIEMPLVAAREWQIQLFAMLGPAGNTPSTAMRADLAAASIFYARYIPGDPGNSQGYQPSEQGDRLTEIARQSLLRRSPATSGVLSEMFNEKFQNPMLGILGGHLLLLEKEPNLNTLSIVVGNLRRLLGSDHPDVNALESTLANSRRARSTFVCERPPMLRESWQLVLKRSVTQPEIVPRESLAGMVAGALWGEGIWMFWNAPESGVPLDSFAFEKGLEGGQVQSVLSDNESILMQQLGSTRSDEAISFGPSRSLPPRLDEASAQRLVYTLGVPRGNVEAMLEKLSEQGQHYESTREQMKPGRQRTIEMEKIIQEIRAMSAGKQEEAAKALPRLIEEDTAGSRISALGLLQVLPNPGYLPFVLSAIGHSKSAFEQFHALYAAYKLLPQLNAAQKEQLKETIKAQRGVLPGQGIKPGSDRWGLSDAILKQL